jgi:hypothetical protein
MTEASELSTGHVYVRDGWAGTTRFCEILGYRRLATLRSLYASGTLRQDTACRQAAMGSRMK